MNLNKNTINTTQSLLTEGYLRSTPYPQPFSGNQGQPFSNNTHQRQPFGNNTTHQGPRHNMHHAYKFSQGPSVTNDGNQNGKRISLDDIVDFIEKNKKFINKPSIDQIALLDNKIEQIIEPLQQNKIKQLDQLPTNLRTIFTGEYMRSGSITNVTTPAETDISYVSSVLMMVVPDFADMKGEAQIEYIEVFLRKIHKESKENFTNFGYDKLGWDCKEFSNNIKNFNFGKDLLRYIADFLVINIFILDYETDSLIYVGEKTFCKYKKNIFLIKIKENHFEPIYTKIANFMDHTSSTIIKLISSCFLVEYLDCDFTNEKEEFNFVVGEENLDKYFEKKEEKKEPNLKKKKNIKHSNLNFGFSNYIPYGLAPKELDPMPIQSGDGKMKPLESHQKDDKVLVLNQPIKTKEPNLVPHNDSIKDDFSDDLNGFEHDYDTDFSGMNDDIEGIIDQTKSSHSKNRMSGHLSDEQEADTSDNYVSDLSESCPKTTGSSNESVPSNLLKCSDTSNSSLKQSSIKLKKTKVKKTTKTNEKQPDKKIDAKVDAKVDKKVDKKVDAKVDAKVDKKVDAKVDKKVDAKVDKKVDAKVDKKVDAKTAKTPSIKTSKKDQKQDPVNVMDVDNDIQPMPIQVQIEEVTNTKTVAQLREIAKTMSLDTSYTKDGKKVVKPKQMLMDDINSLVKKNKH